MGNQTVATKIMERLQRSRFTRPFFEKRFLHYTWIAVLISVMNVFFLWLLIDVLHVATILSSIIVVVGTFIFRYILFIFTKVL